MPNISNARLFLIRGLCMKLSRMQNKSVLRTCNGDQIYLRVSTGAEIFGAFVTQAHLIYLLSEIIARCVGMRKLPNCAVCWTYRLCESTDTYLLHSTSQSSLYICIWWSAFTNFTAIGVLGAGLESKCTLFKKSLRTHAQPHSKGHSACYLLHLIKPCLFNNSPCCWSATSWGDQSSYTPSSCR